MTSETQEAQDVVDLLDQLEDAVAGARRLPLSASVVIHEEETLELIDRIRLCLPKAIVQARDMLLDRERVSAAADEEAERVLGQAEAEAARRVTEATARATEILEQHRLTEQAQARADAVLSDAETRAAAVRAEADAYARDVMTSLEDQLMRAVTTVRRGIDALPGTAEPRRLGRRRVA